MYFFREIITWNEQLFFLDKVVVSCAGQWEWEHWCMYIPHLFYFILFFFTWILSPSVSPASDLHVQWIIWAELWKKNSFNTKIPTDWLSFNFSHDMILSLSLSLALSLSCCISIYLCFLVKINTIIITMQWTSLSSSVRFRSAWLTLLYLIYYYYYLYVPFKQIIRKKSPRNNTLK